MIKSAVKSESTEKKLLWDLFDSRVVFFTLHCYSRSQSSPASKSYLTFIKEEKSRLKKNESGEIWPKSGCSKDLVVKTCFRTNNLKLVTSWRFCPQRAFDICNERSQSLRKNIKLFIMYTNREKRNIKKRNRKKSFQIFNNNKNSPVSASFCLFVARSNIHKSTYNSCSKPVTHTSRLCPAHSL